MDFLHIWYLRSTFLFVGRSHLEQPQEPKSGMYLIFVITVHILYVIDLHELYGAFIECMMNSINNIVTLHTILFT
jgi:hypothetical protein